ncbi:MAG: 2-phospho-L-lactate guanylyltransferase [Candidatus Gagatemarchaeaceae archaeon]
MNPLSVIVPFKAVDGKSRLSSDLSPADRRALSELMLLDVLRAVRGAGLVDRCVVVSSDRRALSLASRSGATPARETSDKGVDAAVERGMRFLKGWDRFLVLPSDLPLLTARELLSVANLGSRFDSVVSPSKSFDGTNLLIFSRSPRLELSYDSDSFWNHVRAVARNSSTLAVHCSRGVLFDVDSPGDLRELAGTRINTRSVEFARKKLSAWAS